MKAGAGLQLRDANWLLWPVSQESRSWPALLGGRGFTPCVSRRFRPFLPWHPNTPWFLERESSVNTLCVTLANLNLVLLTKEWRCRETQSHGQGHSVQFVLCVLRKYHSFTVCVSNLPRCLHKNTTIHFSSFPTRALL